MALTVPHVPVLARFVSSWACHRLQVESPHLKLVSQKSRLHINSECLQLLCISTFSPRFFVSSSRCRESCQRLHEKKTPTSWSFFSREILRISRLTTAVLRGTTLASGLNGLGVTSGITGVISGITGVISEITGVISEITFSYLGDADGLRCLNHFWLTTFWENKIPFLVDDILREQNTIFGWQHFSSLLGHICYPCLMSVNIHEWSRSINLLHIQGGPAKLVFAKLHRSGRLRLGSARSAS